jgi:predicted RNase H-like HicB family nuclease
MAQARPKKATRKTGAYDVILEPSDEGGFTIYVPALPGCISEGDTEEEALENIKDAMALWLEVREEEIQKELKANKKWVRTVALE